MGNVPPPFTPVGPPPPRKNSTALIIVLVVGSLFVVCVGGVVFIGWILSSTFNAMAPVIGCFASFEAARDATVRYAREHDDTLPKAETWQDDVTPYLDKDFKELKNIPFDVKAIEPGKPWGCSIKGEKMTGMAFNIELSGKRIKDIADAHSTILVFEIEEPKMNAAEPYKERDKQSSPKIFGEPRGWIKLPVTGKGDYGDWGEGRSRPD